MKGAPRNRVLVGLTGGLASGKSTVARWMAEAGFLAVDADRLVAELYAPEGQGAAAVRDLFGDSYLNSQGAVDHQRLANLVFAQPEARRKLEEAIHPLVGQRFLEIAAAAEGVVVYEATLLVESGNAKNFDLVITIESSFEAQLTRAIGRGMEESAARARLEAQGDGAVRRSGAGRILRNDGTLEELRRAVDDLVRELRDKSSSA
jgi:dephospho-CoA kinase